MTFQTLLVSKDHEATEALSPVLSAFDLGVQVCGYPEAMVRLTEDKFDAVIVDFDDPHSAALVLQNVLPGNSAVTVAMLSDPAKVRNVFGAGANFVLYKPISGPQAEACLRAATALIKRERRRAFRVPVQTPVQLSVHNGLEMEGILLDLSEDGMDVLAAQPLYPSAQVKAQFRLSQEAGSIEVRGEVAWANPNGQSGVRFVDIGEGLRSKLRSWVAANAPELPPEDPEPVAHCKLTDLSTGGCYVETESPFPERAGIVLTLKAADVEVQTEGMVRVMHPAIGMGVEFASRTAEQRESVEKFVEFLIGQPGVVPELSITPRILKSRDFPFEIDTHDMEDPLLELLRNHESLSQEAFLEALRSQRHAENVPTA
jgi:CheY-like chemotaxis protein